MSKYFEGSWTVLIVHHMLMWTPHTVCVQTCLECYFHLKATFSFFVPLAWRCFAMISGKRFDSHACFLFCKALSAQKGTLSINKVQLVSLSLTVKRKVNFEFYCFTVSENLVTTMALSKVACKLCRHWLFRVPRIVFRSMPVQGRHVLLLYSGCTFLSLCRHMLWHVGIGMSVNTLEMGESRWRGWRYFTRVNMSP